VNDVEISPSRLTRDKVNKPKNADFAKPGETELIITSPAGDQTVYGFTIGKNTYRLEK
jgi:hypothetical protein